MAKLLIAVHSDILAGSIARAMPKDWSVSVCHDGIAAEHLLRSQKPEALIIDLRLPCKDGLAVLKDVFPDLPPAILGLTDYDPAYVVNAATSFGAASVIQVPTTIRTIVERITDIAASIVTPPTLLSRHLDKLGINAERDGYRCMIKVIPILKKDPTLRLHKEVYPFAVEALGLTDVRCVEHSIRSAIKAAWLRRDETVWSFYFPTEKYGTGCPNNQSFLRRLAELIE